MTFKFPKRIAEPFFKPATVSKVEAIRAFRLATQQGLYEAKTSYDASFEDSPSEIEIQDLAKWIRAWFIECYVAPGGNLCGEVALQEATQCALEEPARYHYRKRCGCCSRIFYDGPIGRETYEGMVDNPALKYSREFGTWYLTIESTCDMCH